MQKIISKDGTVIAYDVLGSGPVVIIVLGALSTRAAGSAPQLAELLSKQFTVYNYDRRGRGDSGNTEPYAVEREIEDIEALVDHAGGTTYLYGHSSGAALALDAAAVLGSKVTKLAMYEVPYNDEEQAQAAWKMYIEQLSELLSTNKGGDAVALFMKYVGMPAEQVAGMRQSPSWPMLEAMAPTLAYDHTAILGTSASIPSEIASKITIPTLIMVGGSTYPFMKETALKLSNIMPNALTRTLENQTHDVKQDVLAPVLVEFFTK
jgi:pimeloyl-ACP methyl ester carboxylesterase